MKQVGQYLEELENKYHRRDYLHSDPLEYVHRFSEFRDQEAVGLLCALLAYGNVRQIRASIKIVLDRIDVFGLTPTQFVESLRTAQGRKKAVVAFNGWVYRFNHSKDLILLFQLLLKSWDCYGSLGRHFRNYLKPEHEDIGEALNQVILDWKSWLRGWGVDRKNSVYFLLTAPQDGSCCKRWCMYLRWMVRKDDLDIGLWSQWIRTDQLVIPLDTHTGRMSRKLGLTHRKQSDWKAALEVTKNLKKISIQGQKDPVRYDFALSRVGIVEGNTR